MAGLDALIADGLVDGDRMGVTGGSYGGYLTSWIVGHTDRFKAAVTCRSVNDLISQMLSGDIGGPTFGLPRRTASIPWEDWDLYRRHSPLTYATNVTTPLLIQHAEKDLRCTITQAEELFAVLRSLRKTGAPDADAGRVARADPLRNAVPAGRQPAPDRRVVPPLPGRGQDPAAEDRPESGIADAARAGSHMRMPRTASATGPILAPMSDRLRGYPQRAAYGFDAPARDLRRRDARRRGAAIASRCASRWR